MRRVRWLIRPLTISGLGEEAIGADINMMARTGGRNRTEMEYRDLLQSAGLQVTRVVPTRGALAVLENTAVRR